MKELRWIICLVLLLPMAGVSQQIVITSPEGTQFSFGVDSILYTRRWLQSVSIPIRKENHQFFVLLRGDSSLFVKKIPQSADIHHFVLERSNAGTTALFYRGILAQIPDSIPAIKEMTSTHLSSLLHVKSKLDSPTLTNNEAPTTAQSSPVKTIQSDSDSASLDTSTKNQKESPDETLPVISEQSALDFDATVQKIQTAEFEFEKMMLIKDYIQKYKTNTRELKVLARLLTYDLTRLQLLKESYSLTLDRINYPDLVAVFDFEISKQSLLQFISEHEK